MPLAWAKAIIKTVRKIISDRYNVDFFYKSELSPSRVSLLSIIALNFLCGLTTKIEILLISCHSQWQIDRANNVIMYLSIVEAILSCLIY